MLDENKHCKPHLSNPLHVVSLQVFQCSSFIISFPPSPLSKPDWWCNRLRFASPPPSSLSPSLFPSPWRHNMAANVNTRRGITVMGKRFIRLLTCHLDLVVTRVMVMDGLGPFRHGDLGIVAVMMAGCVCIFFFSRHYPVPRPDKHGAYLLCVVKRGWYSYVHCMHSPLTSGSGVPTYKILVMTKGSECEW